MKSATHELTPQLLERVLQKLGLSRVPNASISGLKQLYEAWCRSVPFDNVRKLIHLSTGQKGALPGDTADDFFEAWLAHGTGGTCWAGNGALHSLLSTIGFDARRGIGTMLVLPGIPPNHGTVSVKFDDQQYLVDASILHVEPLALSHNTETAVKHPAWGATCRKKDGALHVRWRPFHMDDGLDCRLDALESAPGEFSEYHERTRPWSPFNYSLYIRRVIGDRVAGAAKSEQVTYSADGTIATSALEPGDRTRYLVEEMKLSEEIASMVPLDVPTPPPPSN